MTFEEINYGIKLLSKNIFKEILFIHKDFKSRKEQL